MNVEQIADKQSTILSAIWEAYEDFGVNSVQVNRLNAEYDDTVVELLKLLGPDIAASRIDMAQYEIFSNCYKSDTGVRPFGFSYTKMCKYMDDRVKEAAA